MVHRDPPPFDIRKGDKQAGRDSEGGLIFEHAEEEWEEDGRYRAIGEEGSWYCDCPPGDTGYEHRRESIEDGCGKCGAHKEDAWVPDPEDEDWLCSCEQFNSVLDDRCTRCGAEAPWGADDGGDDEDMNAVSEEFWDQAEEWMDEDE